MVNFYFSHEAKLFSTFFLHQELIDAFESLQPKL